jgi:integrase
MGSIATHAHVLKRLNHLKVVKLKQPGIYEDGGGLRLVVGPTLRKRWVLRFTLAGQRKERGLGSFPTVSLEEAREEANEWRRAAKQGKDLWRERCRSRQLSNGTFRQAFEVFFAVRRQTLSNSKHAAQWATTMETYAFPIIGSAPVANIDANDVLRVLSPIWFEKPETARRVLQRMEAVFKSAILRGTRTLASPCIGVAQELGTRHRSVKHHVSLPWSEVPDFVRALRSRRALSSTKMALEFLILTAARSGEVRHASWSEIDLASREWRIPARRTKTRESHTVPLSNRAMSLLSEVDGSPRPPDLIFPNARSKPLSDMTPTKLVRDMGYAGRATPHGFRTSFKVWAAEVARVRDEVSEAALGHKIPEKVRAAYLRTEFLNERKPLMEYWSEYVSRAGRQKN